jgi:hypothetical protein
MKLGCVGKLRLAVTGSSPRQETGGFVRLIALGSVLFLAYLQMGAQAAQTDADKSHTVITLENAWNQAEALHDRAALKLLLADTFLYTDYDGTAMDREEWLRKVQSTTKDYRTLANVVQNAHVYGDAVVVTGIYHEQMTLKGKSVDRSSRFTDTWIFQNGHWECVASQSTLTAP